MASPYGPDLDDVEEPELVPLTQDQAQGLRARMAVFSPWRVLVVQGLAAVLLVLFVWLAFGLRVVCGVGAGGAVCSGVCPAKECAGCWSCAGGNFCVGVGQNHFDCGVAFGGAQGRSGFELAGPVVWVCGDDEGVLVCHVVAASAQCIDC
jgi:hypothetical protein